MAWGRGSWWLVIAVVCLLAIPVLEYSYDITILPFRVYGLPKRPEPPPSVIYLVLARNAEQGEFWVRVGSKTADVNIMCWKDESCNALRNDGAVQWTSVASSSTWAQSRNRLMSLALERERRESKTYSYLIFSDGDVKLVPTSPAKNETLRRMMNTTEPDIIGFRWFEHLLFAYAPPFACTDRRTWNCQRWPNEECVEVQYCDADINAFERESINLLLPYSTHFDPVNRHASQALLNYRLQCIKGYPVQFNGFSKDESEGDHDAYPRNGDPWELADSVVDQILPEELVWFLRRKDKNLQNVACVSHTARKRPNWKADVFRECLEMPMNTLP